MLLAHFNCTPFKHCLLCIQDASSGDVPQRRMLRRETAVELPITPLKAISDAANASGEGGSVAHVNELYDKAPTLNRNLSAEQTYVRNSTPQNYLVPSLSEPTQPRCFKKSIESLQKNSSSDTDYSLQPYKVIKQSSNETNTSLTGSFNVDQSSFGGHDTSLDTSDTNALNTTVIENTAAQSSTSAAIEPTPTPNKSNEESETILPLRQVSIDTGARSLKKQYSIDHTSKPYGVFSTPSKGGDFSDATSAGNGVSHKICLKPPTISTIPATPTKLLTDISSSTSTEESKDERNIPTISTNLVQDEIAKLSSNMKNSSAEEETKDPPLNETMC